MATDDHALERQWRESEARFQALAATAPVGVFLWNRRQGCHYVNPHWEELTGCNAAAAAGEGWIAALHPDDRAAVMETWDQTVGRGREFSLAFRLVRPDGQVKHVLAQATPFQPGEGAEAACVGTLTDVSGRQELETELASLRIAAEAADRAKAAFVANISHEVRTPMNAILGFSALLAEELQDPEHREWLQTIRENGRTLLELIDQLLDLAQLEAGGLELARTTFSLRELLDEVLAAMQSAAAEKKLRLHLVVQSGIEDNRVGDRARLRQVLMNLVGNAVKFTASGSITLDAGGLAPGRAMSQLMFKVADTGIGIPPEAQAGLFRPFTQADPTSTRKHGGTGLGLSICRGLVAEMHGRIWLESKPGAGTTVFVLLPLEIAAAAPVADRPAPACELPSALRVLVAEDNAVSRRLLEAQLRRLGAAVEAVENDDELFARLALLAFDAVLVNLELAGTGGLAAVKRIRASAEMRTSARVPVLGVGAGVTEAMRRECREAGIDEVLDQPFSLEQLGGALRRAMSPGR